jgi:NADH-quinone oxidoreductase subunit M
MLPLLSLLIFAPILAAGLVLSIRHHDPKVVAENVKRTSLLSSLVILGLSIYMVVAKFEGGTAAMQLMEDYAWIPFLGARYTLGVDGISVLFVLLTALLTPLCILVSWKAVTTRIRSFYAALLALEGAVIGVFCALDFVLFYVFWEAMLIPMFLLIGVWGGENRVYAALKFFLYTFIGSVLMLVALCYFYVVGGTFDLVLLRDLSLPLGTQIWLWLALFAAFAVKVPMWPVHTWLPAAHVQAPTAGSVILAGVLLKMGAYGFLRFSLPILPEASVYFTPLVMALSIIAIIYTALVAFAQTDIKKMIAYSSVSHMGFVTLGIFAATTESLTGSILQMLNHGVVSGALFMLVGVIYERLHTRDLGQMGGIVTRLPVYAVIMLIFTMAAVGLPGTNSFVGEFLILLGSFNGHRVATALASVGVVLGALYMLWLYRKMIMGKPENPAISKLEALDKREILMFVPLIALVVWIGLFPQQWINIIEPSAAELSRQIPTPEVAANPTFELVEEHKPAAVKEHH